MDKITKIYTKVAHAGVSFRAMRRAVSLIGALAAALVIGLAGTDAAHAASTGPNGITSGATAECYQSGQVAVHYSFYSAYGAYGGPYYVSARLWMYNFSTDRWSLPYDWTSPRSVTGVLNLNYSLNSVPHGTYYLLTEWKEYQGNSWSQSTYDKVNPVLNWLTNGTLQTTESLCAL